MPGKFFDPARSTVVAGDVVTWKNADFVTHDVRVAAGLYDSGPILRSGSWTQAFDRAGEYPFVCTLHAFMSGNLSVVAATIEAPKGPVLAGGPLKLSGRAPAGTPALTVERSVAGGAWAPAGEPVAPGPDGGYAVSTPAAGRRVLPRPRPGRREPGAHAGGDGADRRPRRAARPPSRGPRHAGARRG